MTEDELTAAIAQHPDDPEPIAVYGDWLADRGDPLGEYIGVSYRLEQMESRADRMALLARSYELREAHETAWLARWNDPYPLFVETRSRFCGLPHTLELGEAPADLAAFERQVLRFPITTLKVRMRELSEIMQLADAPLLRRIRGLTCMSRYPGKLGKELAPWLAELGLANLTRLGLYSVPIRNADIRPLLAGLPKLTSLSLYNAEVAHDLVAELSASSATQHIERLSVTRARVGNAMVAALPAWPALREISLGDSGIDDAIADLPIVELPITGLDLRNTTLGGRGAAWLVRAMPKLAMLDLPGDLAATAAAAFVPIAHQLESIEVDSADERGGPDAVASMIFPHARKLRRLEMQCVCSGLGREASALPELNELGLHGVTDADLAAIADTARAVPLLSLDVQGQLTDEGLARLARSPHLTQLRSLTLSSEAVTEHGIAALLAAPWPFLEWIFAIDARIERATPLEVHRPALELLLYHCALAPDVLARLRAVWGVRLRWTAPP